MMAGLAAYAPRLLLEWQGDDGPSHRAIEGTLVFADVSGFTALSERLERKGKIGAEEMVDILNHIFGELLRVAAEWGGEMLKFGGDALLLFFTGDGHAERGASAAHWMQHRLARVGRVDTGSGRLQLRMSVGMNSGVFDVFRVGGTHAELVIMGPETTVTVAMETAADATEVLMSPSTASALPPACVGPEKDGGRLLVRAPRRKPPIDELPGIADVDATWCVAPAVRPYVAGGGGEPEHRQVTVAFLHVMGVDALLTSAGPDEVAKRLDLAIRHIQDRLEAHRVAFLSTDVAADGTKIMAAAGAPFATGNDEERALRALREIVTADTGLAIRAGVNRGRVFAGDIGPPFRRTYTTIGDPTNTAARVMGRAQAGELLALSAVLDRSMMLFETEQLEPFAAKGKSEPLVAYRVLEARGPRPSIRRELPLLGRDAELAVLDQVKAAVLGGERRAVEVSGQAGMGTSRLLAEALRRAPDFDPVVARCTPYDETVAYSGVGRVLTALLGERSASALRQAIGQHAPELGPRAPLLGLILDVDVGSTDEVDALDPGAVPAKAAEALDQLIDAIQLGTAAVVLEDAHWCDSASITVFNALAALPSPALLCLTRQPGDALIASATQLELGPMPLDAARGLVRMITDRPLLPQDIDDLVARAGGNPLFLSELVQVAASGEQLPESVEAFFTARIDRLDPDERAALRYAAVVGTEFETLLVEKLLAQSGRPPGVGWAGLDAFVRVEARRGTFISVLARDAAYEALPFRQRRSLHQEVGEMLEDLATAGVEELARHFHTAGDHSRTWRYGRSAAERAEARHAYQLAATFHRWAAEAGRRRRDLDRSQIAAVVRAEAEALRRSGRLADALDRYRAARRLLPADDALVPQLCIDRGAVSVLLGRKDDASRWYREAAATLEAMSSPPAALAAKVSLGTANVAVLNGTMEEAFDLSIRAADAAAEAGDSTTQLSAQALAHVTANRLRREDRSEHGLAALRLAERLGDLRQQPVILGNLGVDAHLSGRVDEALGYYARTRDVAARSGQAIAHSVAANNIGEIHLDAEEWDEAEAAFREAEMTAAAAGHWYADVSRANRGRALARQGRREEGIALLSAAVEALRARGAAQTADEVAGWLEQLDELPEPT